MTIQKDGHPIGKTPLSFTQSGGNYPIVLRADFVEKRYYKNMRLVEVPRVMIRIVFPNDTQLVDFNGFTAK